MFQNSFFRLFIHPQCCEPRSIPSIHLACKHAAGDRHQSRLPNHTHTSPPRLVLIHLPLLRGSTASQSVWIIPCGPTTTIHTDRETLRLKRKDSSGSFNIGALTLMDTATPPSCLRIRILCKHPLGFSPQSVKWWREQVVSSLPWGIVWSPRLCLHIPNEFKTKGYYLRLLPAQCSLWDNVLIGRDPPTAEVMLSLLSKAKMEGQEVDGWLTPTNEKSRVTL